MNSHHEALTTQASALFNSQRRTNDMRKGGHLISPVANLITILTYSGWWRLVTSHLRRASLELLNILIDHDWVFWLIGAVNQRLGVIESIFLAYPASESYALAYVYPRRLHTNRWRPWPCGLLFQNGRVVVMFGISATHQDFIDPNNLAKLRQLADRMEQLRLLLGARSKTFAGVLAGILQAKLLVHVASEADLTAQVVVRAIEVVRANELLGPDTPVIVLWGRGFIGRRVIESLDGSTTYSIDAADGHSRNDWPTHLKGLPAIVVNTTLKDALDQYLDVLWPGTIVINEVYPEPSNETIDRLRRKDCRCYHVVGVKAVAVPPFPAAYRGAIPCCAAWPSSRIHIVVRDITQRSQ